MKLLFAGQLKNITELCSRCEARAIKENGITGENAAITGSEDKTAEPVTDSIHWSIIYPVKPRWCLTKTNDSNENSFTMDRIFRPLIVGTGGLGSIMDQVGKMF